MNKIINIKRIWNGWYVDLEIDGKLLHIWTSIDPTNIAAIILSQFEKGLLPDKCVICNENLMLFEITGKNTRDGEIVSEQCRGGNQSMAEILFRYNRPVDMPWICGGNKWEILDVKFIGYGTENDILNSMIQITPPGELNKSLKPINKHDCTCGKTWYDYAVYKYCPKCFDLGKIHIESVL
jgi:hypothetical protein